MAKNRVAEMRRTKESLEEYVVPNLLGIVMRWLQLCFLTPVRLRCVDGRWAMRISPRLVIIQRLLVFLTDSLVLVTFCHAFPVIKHGWYQDSYIMSIVLPSLEMLMPMTIYTLCGINTQWRIERNMTILRQLQKMKSTFKCSAKVIKYERVKSCLLFAYIFCKIIAISTSMLRYAIKLYSEGKLVIVLSIVLTYYQVLFMAFFRLELSLMINEVRSTASNLNDELHSCLEGPRGPIRTVRPKANIRHLSDCYYIVGDMVRQMNSDNGGYLAFFISVFFLRILLTLYNLMIATEVQDIKEVTREVLWSLVHIIKLFILVEPSHGLQEQLKRTRRLVSKLAGESGHWAPDPIQLEPFLLLVQMKIAALEPLGLFTIARPLVASIFGGAITTFFMLTQFRNISERT